MNKALFSASPDSVMRTRPVPDAHSISDIMAPRYLRMAGLYHLRLAASGAADMTVVIAIIDRLWLTGINEPNGT